MVVCAHAHTHIHKHAKPAIYDVKDFVVDADMSNIYFLTEISRYEVAEGQYRGLRRVFLCRMNMTSTPTNVTCGSSIGSYSSSQISSANELGIDPQNEQCARASRCVIDGTYIHCQWRTASYIHMSSKWPLNFADLDFSVGTQMLFPSLSLPIKSLTIATTTTTYRTSSNS